MNETIECPYCKKQIRLTEAIFKPIEEKLREKFDLDTSKKEEEFLKREKALAEKQKELENPQKIINAAVVKKLGEEKVRLVKEIREEADIKTKGEIELLKERIQNKDTELEKARKYELELRKKTNELEEAQKAFEIEKQRQIDEERNRITLEAKIKADEENKYKIAELTKQLSDVSKVKDELARKLQQGSQQTQGEVLELELEELLNANFTADQIEPVPKGIRGADVLQRVYNQAGQHCGTIIWESKHTKTWNDSWIQKLKSDQREVKAELAILLTTVLPKDISNFTLIEGIIITDCSSAVPLAAILRKIIIQTANTRLANVGKNEKKEVLYNYLSGHEFKQRIEAIVESFVIMKSDLEQEKRAITKQWSKREKQIEQVIGNAARMYGDIQGIVGGSFPQIESLELKALTDGSATEELSAEKEEEIPF